MPELGGKTSQMASELDNAETVGRALRVTAAALRPWIEERVGAWPKDYKGNIEPRDPSYLISIALNYKPVRIYKDLGDDGRLLLQGLRHSRNRWAHHVPFEDLDVVRSLDTCRRILLAVNQQGPARTLETQIREVLVASPETTVAVPEISPPARKRSESPGINPDSHRRMATPEFREQQWARRFDPIVEPINRLVDDLIEEKPGSWMPYIPPYHGGVESKVLLIYQDPGKMTSVDHGGSGFLGCENDDTSAQTVAECLDAAGIDQRLVSPWNAYPWFLEDQGNVRASMINEGLDPLRRLLEIMPEVHTVVTGGAVAHDSWRRFTDRYSDKARSLRHMKTFHTSARGITNGGRQTKAEGIAHVVATLRAAGSC